jgi:hypothetical protein
LYELVVRDISPDSPKNLSSSFNTLEDNLKERCSNWPVEGCPVLISIDEVHVLFKFRDQDKGSAYNLFASLKSVLSEAVLSNFCVIFLSTATSIPDLAPAREVAPSIRERRIDCILPTPFCEVPFDAHIIENPLVAGKETLSSVGTLEFAAKFGRPLYVVSMRKFFHSDIHLQILFLLFVSQIPR